MKRFIVACMAAASLALGACTQVDSGNVGVESFWGQVKEQSLPSGVYFTAFKNVREVVAKEIPLELNDMKPKTSDNITLPDLDIAITYKIDPSKAASIYTRYAGDIAYWDKAGAFILGQNVVLKNAREAAQKAVNKHHSSKVHLMRDDIAADTLALLQKELDNVAGAGWFYITNVIVNNVETTERLNESIQAAAEVEFQTRQKKQQKALAQEESDRLKIEAEGLARANRIVADSLTPQLLRLREIEATAKFAENGNSIVLQGGSGAGVFVNAGKK